MRDDWTQFVILAAAAVVGWLWITSRKPPGCDFKGEGVCITPEMVAAANRPLGVYPNVAAALDAAMRQGGAQ